MTRVREKDSILNQACHVRHSIVPERNLYIHAVEMNHVLSECWSWPLLFSGWRDLES